MANKPAAGRTRGKKPASRRTADSSAVASDEAGRNQTRRADEGKPIERTVDPDEVRDLMETMEAEKLMPPIEVLEKMADRLHPPQSWFDEEIDDV